MYGSKGGGAAPKGDCAHLKDVKLPATPMAPLSTNKFTKQSKQDKPK